MPEMEQPTGDFQDEGATRPEAATPASEAQPEDAWSSDELRELLREVVQEENAGFWRSIDRRFTPIEELRSQVEDLLGRSRKTEALVSRLFDGTYTPEDRERLEQAEALKAKDAELARERERREQATKAFEPETERRYMWQTTYGPLAKRTAEQAGLTWQEAQGLMPTKLGRPSRNDPLGFLAWFNEYEKNVDAEVDKRTRAATPPPRVPAERPAGQAVPAKRSAIDYFKADIAARRSLPATPTAREKE